MEAERGDETCSKSRSCHILLHQASSPSIQGREVQRNGVAVGGNILQGGLVARGKGVWGCFSGLKHRKCWSSLTISWQVSTPSVSALLELSQPAPAWVVPMEGDGTS